MRVAAFSTKAYDREFLLRASAGTPIEWCWFEVQLEADTARLAEGAVAVNCFVNDRLDARTLEILSGLGVRLVTLRCAGFNGVDLVAAARLHMPVVTAAAAFVATEIQRRVALARFSYAYIAASATESTELVDSSRSMRSLPSAKSSARARARRCF